jgi:hypothetical protein
MFGYVVCFVVDMRSMQGEKWGFSMRKMEFSDGFLRLRMRSPVDNEDWTEGFQLTVCAIGG